jgi:BirA family biotin operon repressor/biotin-[acetyl-CoA-carboxylase] ligase
MTQITHVHFDSIDSTQRYARQNCKNLRLNQWHLCTANLQTLGEGAGGSAWLSPRDVNLYATYSFLVEEQEAEKMLFMPQVSCLQVVKLLELQRINSSIKWVNDVLVKRKKICGILLESISGAFKAHDTNYTAILIGVGINVNSVAIDLAKVSQPATSMFLEIGRKFEIEKLTLLLSKFLIDGIEKLMSSGFECFRQDINTKLEKFDNKPVVLKKSDGEYFVGRMGGIAANGGVIIENHDSTEIFTSGRILRGSELLEAAKNVEINRQIMGLL